MRRSLSIITTGIIILGAAWTLDAEEIEGKKYEDAKWHQMVHVKFHAGKMSQAQEMIREHFVPATEAAGTSGPAMVVVHHSGPWDMTVFWHMTGGIGDMEWERSPESMKWWAAFVERSGGEEKAVGIMNDYESMVAATDRVIVREWS